MDKSGSKNTMWKGDGAGYDAKHDWVQRHKGRTGKCEDCGKEGKTELSNIDHKYRRVLSDWKELCVRCHRRKDGWTEKMLATRRARHGY